MAEPSANAPRLLILAADEATRTELRNYAVRSWPQASVQTQSLGLPETLQDPAKLQRFDVVIVNCDFAEEAKNQYPTLQALRAATANPRTPPLIVRAEHGSEAIAVQAIKFGAADYIPRRSLNRRYFASAVGRLLPALSGNSGDGKESQALDLFGYALKRRIAANGSIAIYVAFSAERGQDVVLKLLHRARGSLARDAEFEQLAEEFKRSFDIADRAVGEIYDFRVTSQNCYIAMEYFPFGSLAAKLAKPLAPAAALGIAEEIARALAVVHAAGVVHRDLKPGNIMMRDDGSVALIDFGIAESAQSKPADRKQISGTPYYMSPEQARGEATDERTDLYALGIMLYQMLTGEKPYVGESTREILDQHCEAPLPTLPEPFGDCQDLITRTLAKLPAERVGSARELIELISAVRANGNYVSDDGAAARLSA